MRFVWIAGICLIGPACSGDGGTDPVGHQIAGHWSHVTTQLADGHSTTCGALTGGAVTLAQSGANFDGTIIGGNAACLTGSVPWTLGFGSGKITKGRIIGDSVVFEIDAGRWRSWGRFVTDDSMAGFLNAIYPTSSGSNLIMTGYWSARRLP